MSFHIYCKIRFVNADPYEIDTLRPKDRHLYYEQDFYAGLLEDIRNNGIRNPILVFAYKNQKPICKFGMSRLWAAQEIGLKSIPIIVNDFDDKYPHGEEILTVEDARQYFSDQPRIVKITKLGLTATAPIRE